MEKNIRKPLENQWTKTLANHLTTMGKTLDKHETNIGKT